jgi:hypothetical protein
MPDDPVMAPAAPDDTIRDSYARAAVLRTGAAARASRLPDPIRDVHRGVLRSFAATGGPPGGDELDALAGTAGTGLADAIRLLAEADLVHLGPSGQVEVAYPFSGRLTGHTVFLPGQAQVEYRNQRWRWDPGTAVVVLGRTLGHGPNARQLCPSITFHADREGAAQHLASHPELMGMVATQATAVELARLSFGALLT